MTRLSFPKEKVQFLLLEGIHENAIADLAADGYSNVVRLPGALDEDELIRRLEGVHLLGIRSRTKVTPRVLEAADRLIAVGCFCIGTDQVALEEARRRAIPVFNAPFSNTRSVAELVLGQIIMLMRGIFPKSVAAHRGEWIKSAANSWEVRGKTLGIVGYGNIGAQLSVLAESLGMHVIYYDPTPKLPLGRAESYPSLAALLGAADVVSLHVPDTNTTRWMMGAAQIRAMRPGSFLINASRGRVVDVEALATAIRDGHLLGAAADVFPDEPASAREEFLSPLRGLPNVILTPHIGGSTAEAQARIGNEVARKLIDYSDIGSTFGAVNFPQAQLPSRPQGTRFIHVHRNTPGLLARVIDVFTRRGLNIGAQYLQTDGELGYVVIDIDGGADEALEIQADLRAIDGTIRARFLYERG
ncbi:MAG: phosphoglycerate dehydrogenase [Geminicoccaceae bacterium]